ncbi:MAG: cytidylate kinase-like family protein [Candidatus Alcyoniella australis]|nr:cytidylate kinase-like family protein [Candidatus Alcyoniella australis]
MPNRSSSHPSIEKVVDEKAGAWSTWLQTKPQDKPPKPVVTISREPGSGGKIVAREVADLLGLHVFDRELIQRIAASAQMREEVVKTLDERQNKLMDNWILAFFTDRYLWPDLYIKHLAKVLFTIGQRGDAVIIGRGANFLIPPEACFRVRVVAPKEKRAQAVAKRYTISLSDAEKFIQSKAHDRKGFAMQHFNADIADAVHYDLVINTGHLSFTDAAQMIKAAIKIRYKFKTA